MFSAVFQKLCALGVCSIAPGQGDVTFGDTRYVRRTYFLRANLGFVARSLLYIFMMGRAGEGIRRREA
jgi:hypothetical protein